ncbi:MAG: type I-E CRISPR-associated protein Cse2/CasB [Gammaproteobacteria bacterium]|nr:type I-E CRISPR-associated protein Cse2/CasB [Gammaproteobacteria bacterium]MYF53503.1 type I-E CRISPR-associated protein Cse2/CasB [Gammaproteobacteria bacterium]MYK44215.1 type I-E CRISPR-associated protein Cse2/CasB [Gammaproteobacteria bacterium]
MTTPFKPETIAFDWWKRLNPDGGSSSSPHRDSLARMRRADTPIEVFFEPEAIRLAARFNRHTTNFDRVAIIAGVLAHVRETDERSVARAIGRTKFEDDQSAAVSESRFRRLLQAQNHELLDVMRRLVRMLKGHVNVLDLSNSIFYWGDRVRQRWIFDYYGVDKQTD